VNFWVGEQSHKTYNSYCPIKRKSSNYQVTQKVKNVLNFFKVLNLTASKGQTLKYLFGKGKGKKSQKITIK